jgi:predicted nuclease with RNAse H fold
MMLAGADYTSAPRKRKPITVCHAELDGSELRILPPEDCPSHTDFEEVLKEVSLIGIDAPLGQPVAFLESIYPEAETRADVVARLSEETMATWVEKCRSYRGRDGERELFRQCDRDAQACSPMKCFFIPVGRMFLRAVQSLDRCGFVLGGLEDGERKAVEIYPTLAVKTLTGQRSYKTDDPKKDTEARREVRRQVVNALRSTEPLPGYGLKLKISEDILAGLADDPKADRLDAILAAVQTAWAATQPNFGVPESVDPREGTIVDFKR